MVVMLVIHMLILQEHIQYLPLCQLMIYLQNGTSIGIVALPKFNCRHIIPIQKAIQDHPKAGRMWETHINFIRFSPELDFRTTTHD